MPELVAGAVLGALTSQLLQQVIAESKKVLAFKYLSKDLASTMEDLLPKIIQIESMQKDAEELKNLIVIIESARKLVSKCLDVKWWDPVTKSRYTRKVEVINKEMVNFCQVQLQLTLLRNQMQSMVEREATKGQLEIIEKKLDLLSVPAPRVFRDLLGAGAVLGAFASQLLKKVIAEVKKVLAFKYLSKELALTMEDLLPIIIQIESMQIDAEELKKLMVIIERAHALVSECSKVKWWDPVTKSRYTREIEVINQELLKFCEVQVQLIILRNQRESMVESEANKGQLEIIEKKPDVSRYGCCSVPKVDKVFVGLDFPLMEVKKKLLDDSVDNIVVYAAPGCGKTTLVTQLCHDVDIKGEFKHIFFIVVSSTPNFRGLVQNLLQHNGYEAITFDNDHQAIVALRNLLEELEEDGPILLVLDDVWHGAEFFLEKFQSFQIDLLFYKVLVTSRSSFPSFGSTYHLKPLNDEDARSLLIQWASPPHHTSTNEYEKLLREILKRCNGFPLVIEVVGASLKGKALYLWKGQVETWFEEETFLGNLTVLQCLEPSFNSLEPHLKECFLDMGLFLEDQKIRASVVIDIWEELYGSSSSVYMNYLDDLASHNLLKLVHLGRNEPKDGFYNELLVTQHDILRELAIFQSKSGEKHERKRLNLKIRDDEFPDWCLDRMQPINARLLSISTDDLFSSNWVEIECPNVEALVLNLSSSSYELPNFIATMKKLKVVIIISHGINPAKLTNLSCFSSLPNVKRIRFESVSISFMDILQLQLKSLKKLSFVMCSFTKVLHGTKEIDVSKSLQRLQEIEIDDCYDLYKLLYWVSEVVSMKTLSMTHCGELYLLPEAIGNLSKLEVLRLCACTNLSKLPETTERLNNLQILDISGCLSLRKLPLGIGKLQNLKKILMNNLSGCDLPDSVRNIADLEVKCDAKTELLWKSLKPIMINLAIVACVLFSACVLYCNVGIC